MAPLVQSLPSSSKPRPPQVEIEPYVSDWHKTTSRKSLTRPDAETEDNKVGDNIQYIYSEEYIRWSSDRTKRRRRTDRCVIKKVRFSLGNVRVQSLWAPSNQFRFPTKKELQEWAALRRSKRKYSFDKSPVEPNTKKKMNMKRIKKKDKEEASSPNLNAERINNTEQKSSDKNEAVDKQLGGQRRINIVFNDSNYGFLLQPVAGRWKAMVAEVTRELMEKEKLYPGMRVCSIDGNPIPPSCSFADVQAMIEQLRTPSSIGFVDVCKNSLKYDQMVIHMVEQKQREPPQIEQIDQRKKWVMNLQMQNPLMYQQYVIQHQIGRLQAHIENIKPNPGLKTQLAQAQAHMDFLKDRLTSLSQPYAVMSQKQQGSGPRSWWQDSSSQALPQGASTKVAYDNAALAGNSSHPNSQLSNTVGPGDAPSTAHLQQADAGHATSITNINNTTLGHPGGLPNKKGDARIQIALSQLAALKQIYTRSPQTAIAQLAGLLQMAEKNEIAVSQLRNLQEAAKRDAELAALFSNLQKTAFSVLQRHIARQEVSKKTAPQCHRPSEVKALKRNEMRPKI